MNTKKVFSITVVLAIATTVIFNIKINSKSERFSSISLSNIEALANNEGGNSRDCPGGYCSYSDSFSSCTACCPTGKDPHCSSSGCYCN